MKKILPALLLPFFLFAEPAYLLPEVIASVDGVIIPEKRIRSAWQKALKQIPEDASPETFERLFRKLAEVAVWQTEIAQMLMESGIKPDRRTAAKYIAEILKNLPESVKQKISRQAKLTAENPEVRTKAAVYFYLKSKVPEKIAVTAEETEHFYRINQLRYKQPGRVLLGILQLPTREKAEMARAALLQGTNFDTVAKRYAPEGNKTPPAEKIFALAKKMRVKEVSDILYEGGSWQVFQLRKKMPDHFISLQEAAPEIAMELAARKEAAELEKILRRRLAAKKITYGKLKLKSTL